MNYLKEIGVEKDLNSMSEGEMLSKIREFNQINLYTVNEYWCIQLFDLEVSANDEVDNVGEFSNTELKQVLIMALEDIAEKVYNRNYDF